MNDLEGQKSLEKSQYSNFVKQKINTMIKTFKILLVEHDKELASITKNYLVSRGYSCVLCFDGEEALQYFRKERFDFVLADVNVPIVNGYDLAKEIKKSNRDMPIAFLGSDIHQHEIIRGFNVGADDFICRPFSMEELGLRVEAIISRAKNHEKRLHMYKFGRYTLDTLHHVLIINGHEKRLTTKEMELLYLFFEHKNRVVERSMALQRIWNSENYFNARNMDVYIGRLRNLLCDDPCVYLENVHGVGYKLVVISPSAETV